MKKKLMFITLLAIFVLTTSLFITESTLASDNKIRISVSNSPSSIPVFYLLENSDLNLEVEIHKNRNIVISNLMENEIDMALLATNEAAKLYNKDVDLKIANVHTWGVFYLATTNDKITSLSDLKGKNIALPDKGGPMDIVFNYIAKKNDINVEKDLKIRRGKVREIAQLMSNDMVETAVLREPLLSQVMIKNEKAKVMLDLQKEWKKETSMELPQSSLVINGEFINEKNHELIKEFNEEYKKAIAWVNNNPKEAAELAEKHMGTKKKVNELSNPRLNLSFKKANEAKEEITNYFEILSRENPKAIGGEMPDEDFYYQY
ncbi:MAG: ABC transporter substrate-binding protein [Bacillota bacterium]